MLSIDRLLIFMCVYLSPGLSISAGIARPRSVRPPGSGSRPAHKGGPKCIASLKNQLFYLPNKISATQFAIVVGLAAAQTLQPVRAVPVCV